jgi:predicted CopG family antitoxin
LAAFSRREKMADKTTILLEKPVRDELRAEKVGNETYNEVIERLLEDND